MPHSSTSEEERIDSFIEKLTEKESSFHPLAKDKITLKKRKKKYPREIHISKKKK